MNTDEALELAQEISDLLPEGEACLAEIDYSGAGRAPTFQIIDSTTGEEFVTGLTPVEAISKTVDTDADLDVETRTERVRFVAYSDYGVEQGYFIPVTLPATATIRQFLDAGEAKGFALARAEGLPTSGDALSFDTYLL